MGGDDPGAEWAEDHAVHDESLFERVGDDMENIRMELEKLISYTMGSEVVTAEDVKVITTVQITNKIFDMVAAITAGKTKRAMDLYEDLLTLREPPMRILFLIARQFNQLLLVRELQASGADRGTVASKLKVPPFVAGKLSSQAAAFTKKNSSFPMCRPAWMPRGQSRPGGWATGWRWSC